MAENTNQDPSLHEPSPEEEAKRLLQYMRSVFNYAHEHNGIQILAAVSDDTPRAIGRYVFRGPDVFSGSKQTEAIFLDPTDRLKDGLFDHTEADNAFDKLVESMHFGEDSDQSEVDAVNALQLVPARVFRVKSENLPDVIDDGLIGESEYIKRVRLHKEAVRRDVAATELFVITFDNTKLELPLTHFVIDASGARIVIDDQEETFDTLDLDKVIEQAYPMTDSEIDQLLTEDESIAETAQGGPSVSPTDLIDFISNNFSPVPRRA